MFGCWMYCVLYICISERGSLFQRVHSLNRQQMSYLPRVTEQISSRAGSRPHPFVSPSSVHSTGQCSLPAIYTTYSYLFSRTCFYLPHHWNQQGPSTVGVAHTYDRSELHLFFLAFPRNLKKRKEKTSQSVTTHMLISSTHYVLRQEEKVQ